MAGRIRDSVVDEVKQRTRIEDIVGDYVTLKPAGVGSLKGLCPFHDEKTPSFNVRPQVGYFHCFGCGESGDVISFIQKIENIPFVEAVEYLARKAGVQVEYDDAARGSGDAGAREVKRSRLIDAHRVAEDFYVSQLSTAEAAAGRELLAGRGFDAQAIAHFRVGYSPNSWSALLDVLRKHGFTEKEIAASGLVAAGTRGPYDRFRGRLMWPIRSITGETIGFGARKINDSEEGPKYLNTPETLIYKKSQVLYGLDLARKAIAEEHRIVVVEGYTDVMAAHLAGVPQAVATCGTAFGHDHAKIARRLIGDSASVAAGVILHNGRGFGGEVVFTFDGDAAGQKAALKVFQEDQSFGAQTFVAILPEGLDPCELRMKYGDLAVKEVVEKREPLFAFVIRSILRDVPLRTAEGRAAGLRASAPVVAAIRDRVLRSEYIRQLAGWLGMEEHLVREAVVHAERQRIAAPAQISAGRYSDAGISHESGGSGRGGTRAGAEAASVIERDGGELVQATAPVLKARNEIRDPVERTERAALNVMLQLPRLALAANAQQLPSQSFVVPIHRTVFDAIRAAGGVEAADERMKALVAEGIAEPDAEVAGTSWFVGEVAKQLDPSVRGAVFQLSVEPVAEDRAADMWRYVRGVMMALIRQGYTRQIADVRSEMQRAGASSPDQAMLFERLIELEKRRRAFDEADS
ncbi:MAG: DNA primase [Arcanobacterium sp.]|nr:DNA primase [Arcanobacterium sp.]MDY5588636.1 DNA primase [Arcanobacterium sp.]